MTYRQVGIIDVFWRLWPTFSTTEVAAEAAAAATAATSYQTSETHQCLHHRQAIENTWLSFLPKNGTEWMVGCVVA